MIHDCFTFFNELDLLDLRLEHMWDHVDRFVIVEGTRTFRGDPKPLYFADSGNRYNWARDKIVHVVVDLPEVEPEYWGREAQQRNGITEGVAHEDPDDLVLITDLDEFPRPESIPAGASACSEHDQPVSMLMSKHIWKLNNKMVWDMPGHAEHYPWWMLVVCRQRHLARETPQRMRERARFEMPKVDGHGGWHFSFIGDERFVKEKIEAFSHTELCTPDTTDPERIRQRMDALTDPFDRGYGYVVEEFTEPAYPRVLVEKRQRLEGLGWLA